MATAQSQEPRITMQLSLDAPVFELAQRHCAPQVYSVRRCDRSVWEMFRRHHYLDSSLGRSAKCFVAVGANGDAVAFCAVLAMIHREGHAYREHRLVVLPDFQGSGVGPKLSETVAYTYKRKGFRYYSKTVHPRLIAQRKRSSCWHFVSETRVTNNKESFGDLDSGLKKALAGDNKVQQPRASSKSKDSLAQERMCVTHEYIGNARPAKPVVPGSGSDSDSDERPPAPKKRKPYCAPAPSTLIEVEGRRTGRNAGKVVNYTDPTEDDEYKVRAPVPTAIPAAVQPSQQQQQSTPQQADLPAAVREPDDHATRAPQVWAPRVSKGPWTESEDQTIRDHVRKFGARKWSSIRLDGRVGKQCRERWMNQLDPEICFGAWTDEEDQAIAEAVAEHGSRWSHIARLKLVPGRTENQIKNRWNCAVKKRAGALTKARGPIKCPVAQDGATPSPKRPAQQSSAQLTDVPAEAPLEQRQRPDPACLDLEGATSGEPRTAAGPEPPLGDTLSAAGAPQPAFVAAAAQAYQAQQQGEVEIIEAAVQADTETCPAQSQQGAHLQPAVQAPSNTSDWAASGWTCSMCGGRKRAPRCLCLKPCPGGQSMAPSLTVAAHQVSQQSMQALATVDMGIPLD